MRWADRDARDMAPVVTILVIAALTMLAMRGLLALI
jgi:hypothetical protein